MYLEIQVNLGQLEFHAGHLEGDVTQEVCEALHTVGSDRAHSSDTLDVGEASVLVVHHLQAVIHLVDVVLEHRIVQVSADQDNWSRCRLGVHRIQPKLNSDARQQQYSKQSAERYTWHT